MMNSLSKQRDELIAELKNQGIADPSILKAMTVVAREAFVPHAYERVAYENRALPIGQGQTISQPYTVARMLELLDLKPSMRILEIGTGSGNNAALLASIVGPQGHVDTIEVLPALASRARECIERLGLVNVSVITADGSIGNAAGAPYDRIIATAATPRVPKEWKEQLRTGGIIVAPVGSQWGQVMQRFVKRDARNFNKQNHGLFQFVPLVGKRGQVLPPATE